MLVSLHLDFPSAAVPGSNVCRKQHPLCMCGFWSIIGNAGFIASSEMARRAWWPYIPLSAMQEDIMPSIDDEELARQVRARMAHAKAKRRKLMCQAGGLAQLSWQR